MWDNHTHDTELLLALEGGGSKCEAVLLDSECNILGRGVGGPVSTLYVTQEQAVEAWITAGKAALNGHQGRLVCLAVSGSAQAVGGWLEQALGRKLSPERHLSISEARAAYRGALISGAGMLSLLGTGSFVYAQEADGRAHHYGGLGPLLGDEGSGFDIGRALLASALLGDLAPEPRDRVLEAAARALNVPDARSVLYAVYTHRWPRREIASLSRLAGELAEAGEAKARDVMVGAMERAAAQVHNLAKRVGWDQGAVRYSATGGVVLNCPLAKDSLLAALRERLPGLRYEAPRLRPVLGCALEGVAQTGWLPEHEAARRLQAQQGTPISPT